MGRISEEAKEIMFQKKQESIKSISETKEIGMTFSNALNNAVSVWTVLIEHPEVKPIEALEDIQDLIDFFRGLKEEIRAEITTEHVAKEAEKVPPGSEVYGKCPDGLLPPPPPPSTPVGGCSEPQVKMIHAKLNKLGYKSDQHTETIRGFLGLTHLEHLENLTKSQASDAITLLVKMEERK